MTGNFLISSLMTNHWEHNWAGPSLHYGNSAVLAARSAEALVGPLWPGGTKFNLKDWLGRPNPNV